MKMLIMIHDNKKEKQGNNNFLCIIKLYLSLLNETE